MKLSSKIKKEKPYSKVRTKQAVIKKFFVTSVLFFCCSLNLQAFEEPQVLKHWLLQSQSQEKCRFSGDVSMMVRYTSFDGPAILTFTVFNDSYVTSQYEESVARGMRDAQVNFNVGQCATEIKVGIQEDNAG